MVERDMRERGLKREGAQEHEKWRKLLCMESNAILTVIYALFELGAINRYCTCRSPVVKLSIATGHAIQIYNCLNCPRQL